MRRPMFGLLLLALAPHALRAQVRLPAAPMAPMTAAEPLPSLAALSPIQAPALSAPAPVPLEAASDIPDIKPAGDAAGASPGPRTDGPQGLGEAAAGPARLDAVKLDSLWDGTKARDPQDAVAPETEGIEQGAALAREALPILHASEAARLYARFLKENPIAVSVSEPDPRLDRIQKGQSALFDNVFPRLYLNRQVQAAPADWASTLLHELKHYKTRAELKDIASQENELEAYHVQALFLLEQIDQNPGYLEALSPDQRGRAESLLEDWIRGPEALALFVRNRYVKTPSVFDDAEPQAVSMREQLARWQDRLDNYEERKAELAEQARQAKIQTPRWGGDRAGGGSGRAEALERALRNYPFRESVEHVVAVLGDAAAYWEDPARVQASREHYAKVRERVRADWSRWKAAHPDFRLSPPSVLERLIASMKRIKLG